MTHDPRALLLTTQDVASRIGWHEDTVTKARKASDPRSSPRPMSGWVNIGSDAKPRYALPESALIAYIEGLDRA